MQERPILMSRAMVRAVLEGSKTQTRRIVIPIQSRPRIPPLDMEPWYIDGERQEDDDGLPCWFGIHPDYPTGDKWFSCPYGGVGWQLWVRETWREGPNGALYRASDDCGTPAVRWKPSIHMPRKYSRLTLEVTDVRVERLQDISETDCAAELGCPAEWTGEGPEPYKRDLRGAFASLWDMLYGKQHPWASNVWVWVITFRLLPSTEVVRAVQESLKDVGV